MNLDNNPTREQFRELLPGCDDLAGNHVVWVTRNGDVKVSVIQHPRVGVRALRDQPAVLQLQQDHPEMQMRCETMLRGNEYVGSEGAENDEWVSEFFDILLSEWPKVKGRPEVAYVPVSDGPKMT